MSLIDNCGTNKSDTFNLWERAREPHLFSTENRDLKHFEVSFNVGRRTDSQVNRLGRYCKFDY